MDTPEVKKIWLKKYKIVPQQLEKIKEIESVATAFNTNIDAVIKLSAARLKELITEQNLSLSDLENPSQSKINSPEDVLKGIFKCFKNGIAEEWITENIDVYRWVQKNLGYDRLQMGGQGGIMANVLALTGIKQIYVHANSLPKRQAEQFVEKDNLLSFDETGAAKPAYQIDRVHDIELVHWIIEFDRGDVLELEDQKIRCPKSNRFIVTYDPLNLKLVTDPHFLNHMRQNKVEYLILSGFHSLNAENDGEKLIHEAVGEIKLWKQNNPKALFHLEIASTQDKKVRQAIVRDIIPLVDSIGVNERETMELLEVLDDDQLCEKCRRRPTSENLFSALVCLKEKLGVPRIQLHMYGLYIVLQNKDFPVTPLSNLRGMMTAATVAAAKASTGSIKDMLCAHGSEVSDVGLIELENLMIATGQNGLLTSGLGRYCQWDLIAIPTILVEKPLTLVGMGDTISSISLLAAR